MGPMSDTLSRVILFLAGSVVAVAGTAAVHAAYEHFSPKVKTRNRLGWAFILFALAVNTFIISLAALRVEDLHKSQRLEVNFYPATKAYAKMQEVIADTKPGGTIYAVNSFEVPFRGLVNDAALVAEAQRKEYFRLIEEKMGHANYYRVLQIRDTETSNIAALVGPTYIEHFKKVMALQETPDRETVAKLQVAHAHFSMSFVIVENIGGRSHLIWQVDNRLPGDSGYKAAGYMIVDDPDQVVVHHFKTLFYQVTEEKGVRRVRPDELLPTAGAALPGKAD